MGDSYFEVLFRGDLTLSYFYGQVAEAIVIFLS